MQKKSKTINERPGSVVCICEKNGNISLFDPAAYRRTEAIRRRKADARKEKENADAH